MIKKTGNQHSELLKKVAALPPGGGALPDIRPGVEQLQRALSNIDVIIDDLQKAKGEIQTRLQGLQEKGYLEVKDIQPADLWKHLSETLSDGVIEDLQHMHADVGGEGPTEPYTPSDVGVNPGPW